MTARDGDIVMNTKRCRLAGVARLRDSQRHVHRGTTYRMIFALIYGLGLRVGEATRLLHDDMNRSRSPRIDRQHHGGRSGCVVEHTLGGLHGCGAHAERFTGVQVSVVPVEAT